MARSFQEFTSANWQAKAYGKEAAPTPATAETAPAETTAPETKPQRTTGEDNIVMPYSDIFKSAPEGKGSRKKVSADITDRSDAEVTRKNRELEATKDANKYAAHVADRLRTKVAPGLASNDTGKFTDAGSTASSIWATADKHLSTLERHVANMPQAIMAKAQQHREEADNIDHIFHGKSRDENVNDVNVGKEHPTSVALRESAAYLERSAGHHSLKEHMSVHNNLTEARAILNSQKEREDNGKLTAKSKFRDYLKPEDIHAQVNRAIGAISAAHDGLNSSVLTHYGIGSPVASDDIKALRSSSSKLLEKAGSRAKFNAKDPMNRDINEEVAQFSTNEKGEQVLTNPKEALADPEHVWFGEGPDRHQVHATRENVEAYTGMYGTQHKDLPRLKQMANRIAKGTPAGKASGRRQAGLAVYTAPGTGETKAKRFAPVGPKAKTLPPELKAKVAKTKAKLSKRTSLPLVPESQVDSRIQEGEKPVKDFMVSVADRPTPEAVHAENHEKAIGQINAGGKISPELRGQMSNQQIVAATVEAKRRRDVESTNVRKA